MLLDIIDIAQQVKTLRNIQPFFADTNAGGIGVAHNGNHKFYFIKKKT